MTAPPTIEDGDPVLVADAVSVESAHGVALLQRVDFRLRAGELVAVVGASGAGKTTLIRTLAGLLPPSSGRVTLTSDHRPLGYVPQDDIVHLELTVRETVKFAARLRCRFEKDSSAVREAVERTVDRLGLTDCADTIVGSLSGGQRKRVSIATELVARPRVCLLDEPTSGLDPASAAELVCTLRDLADHGTAVVFTTHQLADLRSVDRVVVVGPGGVAMFDGPPSEAPDLYRNTAVDSAVRRRSFVGARASTDRGASPRWTQLGPLTHRNVVVLLRNRLATAIMVGAPLAVIAMMAVLFQGGSAGPGAAAPDTGRAFAYWLAFAGFFFGLTFGLLQICGELAIARRELHAAVHRDAYLASKVLVLVPVLIAVDAVMVGVLLGIDRLVDMDARRVVALFAVLVVDSFAGLAMGLLASAAVVDAAQATLMLPMLCFPAVLFGGAVVPVGDMTLVGRGFANVTSTRWAFDAVAVTVSSSGGRVIGPLFVTLAIAAAAILASRPVLHRRVRSRG
jgi:ABC-type multidrug transport system ATPase subunit